VRPADPRFRSAGARLNQYQLSGVWSRGGGPLLLRSSRGAMRLRFSAAKLHLVAAAPEARRFAFASMAARYPTSR
jgi:hypothetical protein